MNTFKWNLACKCIRLVCFSTPNLTVIGKKGPVQGPQSQNLPKIVVLGHRKPTQWTHLHKIWRVSLLLPVSCLPSFISSLPFPISLPLSPSPHTPSFTLPFPSPPSFYHTTHVHSAICGLTSVRPCLRPTHTKDLDEISVGCQIHGKWEKFAIIYQWLATSQKLHKIRV